MVRAATAAALLASIAVTALCASSQQASAADSYPSRRITFVVPYPAGGATDVLGSFACQQIAGGVEANRRCREQVGRRRRRRQRLRRQGAARRLHRAGRYYPDHSGAEPRCESCPTTSSRISRRSPRSALSTIVLVVPEQQPIKSVKELIDLRQGEPRQCLTAPSATPRRPISTANCSRRSPIST